MGILCVCFSSAAAEMNLLLILFYNAHALTELIKTLPRK